ncbi:hypothetical protein B296_00054349 [Ensete ventricosum]|uniref:Uncharacterized protein n=1 Tax=Ensete ventricosum TaxID=4639 RepID=A0A426XTZ7_ENSVE|nr:hypothetical protein B296_00054349 [Ensete ventricosum]
MWHGRTVDLAQVRPNPQRSYGSCVDTQPLLEDDVRPRVPFTRIKPRAVHGHGRSFPRPHQPGPSTSGNARAFDGSPIGSPGGTLANRVTDGPRPGNPARHRGATALGRRSPPNFPDPDASPIQSRSYNPAPTELDLDTLSTDTTDSLREQVRRVHQRLNEVQKEILKSREEVGESSKGGSPFTLEIQSKPLPATFRFPALEPYDGSGDPMEHIATFRT